MRRKAEVCTNCKARRGSPHKVSCRYSLGLDMHQSYTYVYVDSNDYSSNHSHDSSSYDSGSSGGCDG